MQQWKVWKGERYGKTDKLKFKKYIRKYCKWRIQWNVFKSLIPIREYKSHSVYTPGCNTHNWNYYCVKTHRDSSIELVLNSLHGRELNFRAFPYSWMVKEETVIHFSQFTEEYFFLQQFKSLLESIYSKCSGISMGFPVCHWLLPLC